DRAKSIVEVRVSILDPDERVKPEMSASVTFQEPHAPRAERAAARPPAAPVVPIVLVPKRTVVEQNGQARAWVVSGATETRRARHIGFIFQLYNLIPVLTAFENVELPLLLTNLSKAQRRDHVMTALDIVALSDRAAHYPRQLSGGQEQRVAIARAIVTDPTLLLADEPTGDLDAKSAAEGLTLLQRLNREFKKTIVMVTSDPHAAQRASHVYHLEKGTFVAA